MTVIAYDVNETMSDMAPLARRFADVGAPEHLLATWFNATLRDGSALSITGTPQPFAQVARGVLAVLWSQHPGVTGDPDAASEHVLAGFTSLELHPDIAPGLRALAAAGHRQVTISNGAASVAQGLLERNGLSGLVEHVLSVEDVGAWKPDRRVYEYTARTCGVEPGEVVLVAVHPWDLHGAKRAGMRTAYLDRTGAPWPASFAEPDFRLRELADLAGELDRSRDAGTR